ncbi:hypothetical protein RRG08_066350 [Elysia crispata]|uniref:Uncharacterized protein n=1 Tax=Elysia crispata TaxID=231223 RepID=A0AAE0Y9A5_9GAST|nr:hypothetical protein RRG08_066350 [Elysia crispata]
MADASLSFWRESLFHHPPACDDGRIKTNFYNEMSSTVKDCHYNDNFTTNTAVATISPLHSLPFTTS